ncbi:hypothetical protein EZV62_015055 [Acer yangbiense]|uniref:Uncharacterized protein n=1 Tax=Acer yangbiense TaxID=1000413 RepID=A0A5C7HWG4_9ROSI|nr:hypothetical protein EZV62_015055 [Acer yangbiense]
MAEEKESTSIPLSQAENGGDDPEDPVKSPPTSSNSSTRQKQMQLVFMNCIPTFIVQACCFFLQSWVSKKFMTGCVVLFPVAVTFFITWWFIQFVDGFFSPIYDRFGFDIFGKFNSVASGLWPYMCEAGVYWHYTVDFYIGPLYFLYLRIALQIVEVVMKASTMRLLLLSIFPQLVAFESFIGKRLGFITSLVFVFLVGVFVSSWVGSTVFWIGEWFIKRMPFVRHLYTASKQISAAISPDQNTTAFKEVAIIRHPRIGEYAFGFITSTVILQRENEDEELCSVFVPTNHLYIGDIFLVNSKEIIRPNLSIREGIEIIVSGGMTMPQVISPLERVARQGDRIPLNRII